MSKLFKSLSKINYKLFAALLVLGLCPTIYTTVRIFLIGQLPSEWAYSIAGQLSWVNLLYEILQEAIILPLFYFIGQVLQNRQELENRVKTGLVVTFGIYLGLAIVILIGANLFVDWMAVNREIAAESANYIRLESVANIFSMLVSFILIVLVSIERSRYLYILTGVRLLLNILCDIFFVSVLPVSLNLGVNGIAISNITVNCILVIVALCLLNRSGINVFSKEKISFGWMKNLVKIGGISGLESLVRNLAYMLMIVRMVNVVNEQGTYWVANNFIWGWLLLPINQLAELIKRDVASDESAIREKTLGYFTLTIFICIIWLITIPGWKPFMMHVLLFEETDKLFSLVMILLGFYVLYAVQNIFDATFYGLGKTNYMLFESIVTNSIYYGTAFILYKIGVWIPSLNGIALLFGIGVAFDSIVSFLAYVYLLKKRKKHLVEAQ